MKMPFFLEVMLLTDVGGPEMEFGLKWWLGRSRTN